MRPIPLLGACVLAAACGSDSPTTPTAPTPAPPVVSAPATMANISGRWNGSMQFVFDHRRTLDVSMSLQQDADGRVTGTWTDESPTTDIRGEVTGTLTGVGVETRITGTMTISSETQSGTGRCFGRTSIDGPSAPPSMRWTSTPGFTFDNCTGTFADVLIAWTR